MTNPEPRKVTRQEDLFTYPIISTTQLSRPHGELQVPFFETVLKRRSSGAFGSISKNKLADLLYYSAKTIRVNVSAKGQASFNRPSPSAGGIHPIDIIICTLKDRKTELSYYDPIGHSLNKLLLDNNKLERFREHVNQNISSAKDATIVWLVAHQYRTAAKYKNYESLVWRDAGCQLYCLNLVSTALNISCCILGSLGEPYVSAMFKKYGDVVGVGGCLIGGRLKL